LVNRAGGINSGDSWELVQENVIMDNGAPGISHGIRAATYLKPSLLRGNVLWGNQRTQLRVETTGTAMVEGNNIQGGYPGDGNREVDPRRDTRRHTAPVSRLAYDPAIRRARLTATPLPLPPRPPP